MGWTAYFSAIFSQTHIVILYWTVSLHMYLLNGLRPVAILQDACGHFVGT
jgi:hypothetical protein